MTEIQFVLCRLLVWQTVKYTVPTTTSIKLHVFPLPGVLLVGLKREKELPGVLHYSIPGALRAYEAAHSALGLIIINMLYNYCIIISYAFHRPTPPQTS